MGERRRKTQSGRAGSGLSGQSSPPRPDSSASTAPAPAAADAGAGSRPAEEQEERVDRDIKDLLAEVEGERDQYLELAQRTKADFENYRKRVAREAAEAEARGRADLTRQLLPALDNLERALAAAEPRDEDSAPGHLAEGVRLVYEELAGVLRRAGVESYEPAGEQFDPEWHEAMMTRPTGEGDAGRVVEVLEKGYRLNGQMLRPARVVVGELAAPQKAPPEEA